jgi:aminopeptidase N
MTDFHRYLESLIRGDIREAESQLFAEREPFTFPTARPQWAPPRHYDVDHLIMDWRVDLEREHVDAISKLRIKSIVPDLAQVVLHAAELNISGVRDSQDNELEWELRPEDEHLAVLLNNHLSEGEKEELTFTYTIDHPRAGLYFTNPSPEFPDVETSAWTQLQDDYARYVVPIYDNPSHKHSVEVFVTVPEGFYAMSNGVLVERKSNGDGTETFHWLNEKRMPAYLMTIAISQFIEYKENLDGLEVSYYVHPKWDKDTVYRSFGKTPDMIRFFSEKLGVKFPWDKYAQVAVANFIYGGMENVSATTLTDATLHDEKAHRDFDSDGLVSHELAHTWGGDLVTCRTWSHGWLNEGWATQMQNEW